MEKNHDFFCSNIFFNSNNNYINYFKENQLKSDVFVTATNTEYALAKLPKEAYKNSLARLSFDFGAEETWVAEQIFLNSETLTFNCILVYNVNDEWGSSLLNSQFLTSLRLLKLILH